jgi:hypothetical protein
MNRVLKVNMDAIGSSNL